MQSFVILEQWGKTPVDLGEVSWDDVDPCWQQAMLTIKSGLEQQRRMDARRR